MQYEMAQSNLIAVLQFAVCIGWQALPVDEGAIVAAQVKDAERIARPADARVAAGHAHVFAATGFEINVGGGVSTPDDKLCDPIYSKGKDSVRTSDSEYQFHIPHNECGLYQIRVTCNGNS